ncbi:MAG: hypothetical protein GY850_44035 [bacterium]|nr:hypothetical protein [bacterium]
MTSDKQYCLQPHSDGVNRIRIRRNMAAMLAVFASRLYQIPKNPISLFYFMEYTDKFKRLGELKLPAQITFDRLMKELLQLNDERLMISVQRVDSEA